MRRSAVVLFGLLLCPALVGAQPAPERHGFTADGAIGAGVFYEPKTDSNSRSVVGLALAAGVGYFVRPEVALSLRATEFTREGVHLGVIGPHAQLWPKRNVWLGLGIGAGYLFGYGGVNRFGGQFPSVTARVGAAHCSGLTVSLELARIGPLGPISDGRDFGGAVYLVEALVGYQL